METLDIVKAAVAALEDKKAEDVTVIDITGVSSIADYFIIANGSNQNQLTAMQDAVDEALQFYNFSISPDSLEIIE